MSTALRIKDDELQLGPLTLTRTGLHCPEDASEEAMEECGRYLATVEGASQFWIGDLARAVSKKWGDLKNFADRCNLEYHTVATYKSVCEKVSIRIETLSFRHHQLVSSLEPQRQKELLQMAERNRWTVKKLAMHVKATRNIPNREEAGVVSTDECKTTQNIEMPSDEVDELTPASDETIQEPGDQDSCQDPEFQERLRQAKEATEPIHRAMQQFKYLFAEVIDFSMHNKHGKYLAVHSLKDALHQVQTAMRNGIPHGICGYCGGTGADGACQVCLGLGWLNKDRWNVQQRELKIKV